MESYTADGSDAVCPDCYYYLIPAVVQALTSLGDQATG